MGKESNKRGKQKGSVLSQGERIDESCDQGDLDHHRWGGWTQWRLGGKTNSESMRKLKTKQGDPILWCKLWYQGLRIIVAR